MKSPVAGVLKKLVVKTEEGKCFWADPSKYHKQLTGKEAGRPARGHGDRQDIYWTIQVGRKLYKRSHIVFAAANGRWPSQIDHKDGNSLNDRIANLREATTAQNNWNQRTHRKKSPYPRGIRVMPNGNFQARIRKDGVTTHKTFPTLEQACGFYVTMRRAMFGDWSGIDA